MLRPEPRRSIATSQPSCPSCAASVRREISRLSTTSSCHHLAPIPSAFSGADGGEKRLRRRRLCPLRSLTLVRFIASLNDTIWVQQTFAFFSRSGVCLEHTPPRATTNKKARRREEEARAKSRLRLTTSQFTCEWIR